MVNEVRAVWTGPGHNPKYNIWHFADGASSDQIRTSLTNFYTNIGPQIASSYSVRLEPTYRTLNTADGSLIAETAFATVPTQVTGSSAGQPMGDASSALFRWTTGQVVGGRFLKGRTYVPGLNVGLLSNGNLGGTGYTTLGTAATTLANALPAIVIWSRTHGEVAVVNGGTVWAEVAVQRGRRG